MVVHLRASSGGTGKPRKTRTFATGASRLARLNDRVYAPDSLAQNASSFSYPGIGRPVYVNGRGYLTRGGNIYRAVGGDWMPAVAMGEAEGNSFLLGKDGRLVTTDTHGAKLDAELQKLLGE
jgi:hypothetical protein